MLGSRNNYVNNFAKHYAHTCNYAHSDAFICSLTSFFFFVPAQHLLLVYLVIYCVRACNVIPCIYTMYTIILAISYVHTYYTHW